MRVESATIDGGCTCRQVRYGLSATPMFVNCCHCRWCQRESGTAFALNAIIESECLHLLQGVPDRVETPSASGKGQRIARCPRCRVALWSHYAGSGDALAFVRVGTLDDPARFAPGIHIHTASRQPWVVLDPGTPAVPDYYTLQAYWPADSLARRERALARHARSADAPRDGGGTPPS